MIGRSHSALAYGEITLIPITAKKISQPPIGKHLFDLAPYGNFGRTHNFQKLSVIWTPTSESSAPFPQDAVGSVVQYNNSVPTVHLRGLIRLCATTSLGPQLFASDDIELGSEPYHRVLYHLKRMKLSKAAMMDLVDAVSYISPEQLQRDFDQKNWVRVFGELVFALESMANYLELDFRSFDVNYDSCLYRRFELFQHISSMATLVRRAIVEMPSVDYSYFNEVYKTINLELF